LESPVLYFYSARGTSVFVNISLAKGLITEWYFHANSVTASNPRTDYSLDQMRSVAAIAWKTPFTSSLPGRQTSLATRQKITTMPPAKPLPHPFAWQPYPTISRNVSSASTSPISAYSLQMALCSSVRSRPPLPSKKAQTGSTPLVQSPTSSCSFRATLWNASYLSPFRPHRLRPTASSSAASNSSPLPPSKSVATALASGDRAILAKYSRFLEPILIA
jgi:hypothetical protein